VAAAIGLVGGALLGALIVLAIRFFSYHTASVHYHANFGLYINGQREGFKSPFYYEEETACSTAGKMTPQQRAHMHDQVNDVIHVHDHAVTWQQFFENLGWAIDSQFIKTPQQLLTAGEATRVTFILNGQVVFNIPNRVIGDRDRLLVDYGSTAAADLQKEYQAVASTAARYDISKDPASCGGSASTTTHDRLSHLF